MSVPRPRSGARFGGGFRTCSCGEISRYGGALWVMPSIRDCKACPAAGQVTSTQAPVRVGFCRTLDGE